MLFFAAGVRVCVCVLRLGILHSNTSQLGSPALLRSHVLRPALAKWFAKCELRIAKVAISDSATAAELSLDIESENY